MGYFFLVLASAVAGAIGHEPRVRPRDTGRSNPAPRSFGATKRPDLPGENSLYNPYAGEDWFYQARIGPNHYSPAQYAKALSAARDAAKQAPVRSEPAQKGGGGELAHVSGGSWTNIGPSPETDSFYGCPCSGRVTAIATTTTAGTLYLGSAGGGVWKTTNYGTSWTELTDSQPTLAVGALYVDTSTTPNTIYVGTGEGNNSQDSFYGEGILVSTNGGTSWSTLAGSSIFDGYHISSLVVTHPSVGVTYIYVGWQGGLWLSTNGGTSFSSLETSYVVSSMALAYTGSPSTLYVGESTGGIFESTNANTATPTFTQLTSGLPTGANQIWPVVATAPSNSNYLYASIYDTTDGDGFYSSSNGGSSWTKSSTAPLYMQGDIYYPTWGTYDQGSYDNVLAVSPVSDTTVVAAGIGVVMTTDAGSTWQNVNDYADSDPMHPDTHALVFDSSGYLYVGNDGGAYKVTSPGTSETVTNLNTNLSITQFYPGADEYDNGSTITAGSQDNGNEIYTGSSTWPMYCGGDGTGTAIDPLDKNNYYCVSDQVLYNSIGTAVTPHCVTYASNTCQSANFVVPLALVPNPASIDQPTLYFGADHVYKSTDGGATWTETASYGSSYVSTITVDPVNPDVIYVGYNDGTIQYSNDAGTTWTTIVGIVASDSGQWVSSIAISPSSSSDIFVTFTSFVPEYSFSSPLVAEVTGAQGASPTFTSDNGSGGTAIPNAPTNSVIIDGTGIIVGTDVGVFTAVPSGATTSWSALGTGFPDVQVMQLNLTSGGLLMASTHGRGMWEMTVSPTPSPPPEEGVDSTATASPTTVAANGVSSSTITVTLESQGAPVVGDTVSLTPSGGSSAITCLATPCQTNASGQVQFKVTDTVDEVVTYTATDTTDSVVVGDSVFASDTPTVTFAYKVQSVGVTLSTNVVGATPVTYTVTFTTSGAGALGSGSSITLGAAASTLFPTSSGSYSVVDTTTSTSCTVSGASGGASSVISLASPCTVNNLDSVRVTVSGVTNATSAGSKTLSVTTSSDTTAGTVSYTLVPAATSASLSTVVASPTNPAVSNVGSGGSTVTVTLKDQFSNPEPSGISVSLTAGSGSSVITTSPATTNASGVATFTVTDTTVQTVVYTARDVTNSVTITQTASVRFQPVDEAVDSTLVTSNNSPATSSGGGGSIITVTLQQGTGCPPTCTPVSGSSVSLSASGGTSVITCNALPCQTNGLGQVSFTVTDQYPEVVTYSAEDITNLVTVNQTVSLTFVATGGSGGSSGGSSNQVSAGLSTISVSSTKVSADGLSSATVTVHLVSTQGTSLVGKSVSLTMSVSGSSFGGAVSPQNVVTDGNGYALFTVVDSTVQDVTISATDLSDAVQLASSVTVEFVTPIPSGEFSTILATPTQVPADGTSKSTIIVTLRDSGDLLSTGANVTVTGSVSGGTFHGTISPQSCVTDSAGSCLFSITDGTAEQVTISASDTTDSITVAQVASVDFTNATVATNSSFITVSPSLVPVGQSATADVWIEDSNQGPVVDKSVTLTASVQGGSFHGKISPPSGVTTSNGDAVFQVTDPVSETVMLSATDTTDGVPIEMGATLTFQGPSSSGTGQTPPTLTKPDGFEMVTSLGWVGNFGQSQGFGSATGISSFVVGAATTPNGNGYWLVTATGSVQAFGNAVLFGSADSMNLAKPIVGMASTPDGLGYWLVASDGGIFAFGDAVEMGSLGGQNIGQPVAGMAVTSDGKGYWIVTQSGEIFAFGDAPDVGSGFPFGPVSAVASG